MPGSRRFPFPYDCVLHGTGLMLADDGGLAWRERRLESLPPPISGPARAYAQFPSEHEAAWTSWRSHGRLRREHGARRGRAAVRPRLRRRALSQPGDAAARRGGGAARARAA